MRFNLVFNVVKFLTNTWKLKLVFQPLTPSKPQQQCCIYYYSLLDWLENVSKWSSSSITRPCRSFSSCGWKEAAGASPASSLSASINSQPLPSSPQSIPPAKTPCWWSWKNKWLIAAVPRGVNTERINYDWKFPWGEAEKCSPSQGQK